MQTAGILDSWVDLAAALTLGLFCICGLIRGLTVQLVGLAVLLAALVAAHALCPAIGLWIRSHVWEQISPGASRGIAFVLVALLLLVLASLVFHLAFGGFPAKPLLPFDRFLGGILGATKGALIVMAVLLLVVNVLWDEEDDPPGGLLSDFLESRAADATGWVGRKLAKILPDEVSRRIEEYTRPLME